VRTVLDPARDGLTLPTIGRGLRLEVPYPVPKRIVNVGVFTLNSIEESEVRRNQPVAKETTRKSVIIQLGTELRMVASGSK
jgi:hypothetical protein